MPIDPNALITITAYDWVPDAGRGLVRDIRVRWALEEVGQNYAVRLLSIGQQKEPAHRARQPFGQLPTFEEGEHTLFESGAIVWHIAERFPGLMPDNPRERAKALEWVFAALNTVELPVVEYVATTLYDASEVWFEPRILAIERRVDERLQEVSDRLGDSEWYGKDFTAGDLMMVAILRPLKGFGLLETFPKLVDYVERGTARPAFRQALSDHMANFTGSPPLAETAG
ncbi:glutathione S-transferase family protein [Jiella mangrovi]|uniref:Glutathione S-transferase family protein n=1 Tax=Jiella mangrovi TaxID=2821407 RepID=A0ABS4BII4_9HYPH|nr:glutathione S-transferase family protein [Jiella mangrovi]MBP0615770.1 glutathione S-transferase family protein [Jiella mangrovi]